MFCCLKLASKASVAKKLRWRLLSHLISKQDMLRVWQDHTMYLQAIGSQWRAF